jgi:hypothetical protein
MWTRPIPINRTADVLQQPQIVELFHPKTKGGSVIKRLRKYSLELVPEEYIEHRPFYDRFTSLRLDYPHKTL